MYYEIDMDINLFFFGIINNQYCVSSEDCITNFNKIREVNPGEIIKITEKKYETIYQKNNFIKTKCVFEYIYFMKENSTYNNKSIYNIRKNLGQKLGFIRKKKI